MFTLHFHNLQSAQVQTASFVWNVASANMANIQLYHFPGSAPCRSVLMTAKALGVPLELKPLSFLNKDHLSPEFAKGPNRIGPKQPIQVIRGDEMHRVIMLRDMINPDQTVPTIIDGDFTLWESRAIMRYLVGKYGGEDNSLYPRDLQKRAEVDRLLDYDLGVFYRAMIECVWLPFRDKTKVTKEQDEKVIKAFERIDTQVKDKKFLTGNTLTIADFAVVVGFAAEELYPGDMSKYPNAMAWYKRVQELPYYKEANQSYFELLEKFQIGKSEK